MRRSAKNGRALTPGEQLKVLTRIWRPNRDGYVFLPWIAGDSETPAQRRKNYHEGRAFLWPRERSAILKHLQAHQHDDLYFCPNLFNGKRRNEELVYAEMALYADLDDVDPRAVRIDRRPTLAWESSPGRYQGIWLLSGMNEGATWPGRENQRLTYELGADLSGWDATQLLRVPGKPNYKPEYRKANEGDPVPGVLLWDNGPRYTWDDFEDLPEVGVVDGDDLMDEDLLAGIDRHEVWGRVRMRCSPRVRKYMAVRHESEAEDADRSEVLWEIERDLADAGCTLAEIVAIIRPTVWNKYKGRNDELRRLKTEAAKAIAHTRDGDGSGAVEVLEAPKPKSLTSIDDFFSEVIPRPKWLVKDIWPEGGCGFIAGAPKSYKSWLALDLAISLATGTPFLNDPRFAVVGRRKRVLYLQQEDAKSLIKDRFETVVDGKSPEHNRRGYLRWSREFNGVGREEDVLWWCPPRPMAEHFFMEVRSGFVASDEGWQGWLDEMISEFKLDVVIIDTLFASAGDVDTDKGQEMMTKMLNPLRQLSDKHNCAMVIVHHNKKDSGNGRAVDSADDVISHLGSRAGRDMLGTTAMHAWVDTALYVRARLASERLPGLSVEVKDEATGKSDFLGVPGTEILVERESKLAEEIKLRIGIPKMARVDGTELGGRASASADNWSPTVQIGWRRETEGDGESSAGQGRGENRGGRGKAVHGNSDRGVGNGRRREPGRLLVDRMVEMGMNGRRGKTVEEMADILDVSERSVRSQLGKAVAQDWVFKRGEHWFVKVEAP